MPLLLALQPVSDASWINAQAFLQPNPPTTSSSSAPSLYGESTLPCGHAVSLPKLHSHMGFLMTPYIILGMCVCLCAIGSFMSYIFCCLYLLSLFCFLFMFFGLSFCILHEFSVLFFLSCIISGRKRKKNR